MKNVIKMIFITIAICIFIIYFCSVLILPDENWNDSNTDDVNIFMQLLEEKSEFKISEAFNFNFYKAYQINDMSSKEFEEKYEVEISNKNILTYSYLKRSIYFLNESNNIIYQFNYDPKILYILNSNIIIYPDTIIKVISREEIYDEINKEYYNHYVIEFQGVAPEDYIKERSE